MDVLSDQIKPRIKYTGLTAGSAPVALGEDMPTLGGISHPLPPSSLLFHLNPNPLLGMGGAESPGASKSATPLPESPTPPVHFVEDDKGAPTVQ